MAGDGEQPGNEYGGHTGKEWGQLVMDSGVIGMVIVGLTGGECPGIPSIKAFILCFGLTTLVVALLKFQFKLARPIDESDDLRKKANIAVQVLGPFQLMFGIWGIALTFPNTQYFGSNQPACPFAVYMCAFIPSAIIMIVMLVLLGMGFKYLAVDRHALRDTSLDPEVTLRVAASRTEGTGGI